MALLRRGSSRISESNFNARLRREEAKQGAVTASLAWNDPSDLDLHAIVTLSSGEKKEISYKHKKDAGGVLDVDMHSSDRNIIAEPVENIFWAKPPAGAYRIVAKLFKKRGDAASVPFKAMLKREGDDALAVEGALVARKSWVECFKFQVRPDGSVLMQKKAARPAPKAAAKAEAMSAKAKAKARTVQAKARARAKAKAAKLRAAKAKAKAKAKAAKAKAKAKAKALAEKAKARAKAAKAKAKAKAAKAKAKAKGKAGAKAEKLRVYKGDKVKTKSGLTKVDLVKSKGGKVVSAKKSELGKRSKWAQATAKARQIKGYTGYKPIKKGTSFYETARAELDKL